MNKTKRLTLIIGIAGITINIIGLATGNLALGYAAGFAGRLSGALYMVAVDKFRLEYSLPIILSLINILYTSEALLFVEMLVTSTIYQLNAFRLFTKK